MDTVWYTPYTDLIIFATDFVFFLLLSCYSQNHTPKMTIAITATTPSDLKLRQREDKDHLEAICNGYTQSIASLSFLLAVDGQVYQSLLLG
jgi:hypothetical protein